MNSEKLVAQFNRRAAEIIDQFPVGISPLKGTPRYAELEENPKLASELISILETLISIRNWLLGQIKELSEVSNKKVTVGKTLAAIRGAQSYWKDFLGGIELTSPQLQKSGIINSSFLIELGKTTDKPFADQCNQLLVLGLTYGGEHDDTP